MGLPRPLVDPAFQQSLWRWSEERIGWMLRVNRRYGPRRRYAKGSAFAADFRVGAEVGVAASQVSRWESGHTPVRYEIIRGYEDTLGLPESSLVGIADGLYRHVTFGLLPSRLDRHLARDGDLAVARAEALLERALSSDLMGGRDWDELTSLLTGLDRVILRPRDWRELAGRLLTEQLVANGENWRRRHESTHRLLSLPRARPHVIDACASWVRDPSSQVLVEPLSILDMATDASANHLLLEQLVTPVNGQALRGALLGNIGKVRFGHYPPGQLRRVVEAVTELLLDPELAADARPLAAELLRQLPPEVRPGTFQRLRAAMAADRSLTHILRSGRTAGADTARQLVTRVVARTLALLPVPADAAPDPTLDQLVNDILHSPNLDVRLYAQQLLGATPFAGPLARALAEQLRRPAVLADATLASAILETMPFVGTAGQRGQLEILAVADGLPPAVVETAAWRIGHMPGSSDDAYWQRALGRHRAGWQRDRSDHAVSSLRGLTYALGLAGRQEPLSAVRRDPDMPPAVRAAARWWQDLPSAVVASAVW
jgi:transcriptional regulator with XRE-family HTH domain